MKRFIDSLANLLAARLEEVRRRLENQQLQDWARGYTEGRDFERERIEQRALVLSVTGVDLKDLDAFLAGYDAGQADMQTIIDWKDDHCE